MEAQRMDQYPPHYTYEDYLQWEGRWEIIDGLAIAMSPLPVPRHKRIGAILFKLFFDQLQNGCRSCEAYPPIDWKVKDDTVVQPDLLVVCSPVLEDGPLTFPPVLVAEILSPSTAIKDRNIKSKIYASQGVKYYLIIDAKLKKVEVYELIDDKYQLVSENPSSFDFTFHDDCSISVAFEDLWD